METFQFPTEGHRSAALLSKPGKVELARIVPELIDWLGERGFRVIIDRETAAYARGVDVVGRDDMPAHPVDLAVVLGGDGTLLSAARAVSRCGAPILGVNLGSLGFLTEGPLAELPQALQALERHECVVDSRSMVHCQLVRSRSAVASYHALNEVVVSKSAIARLNHFELFVGTQFVSVYKADGLIVSSPTGSTAYSLAAGGPILMPSVKAFVVTPVSPHSLTHRALVVPVNEEIQIVIKTGSEEAYLSVDGQIGMPVHDGDHVVCRKSDYQVKLLRMDQSFFDVLRTKLKWGQR